ncbi:hypothetical protein M501DRAFT_1060515 [Patellaria atrata CBS 101060]|uniref:Conidiation-specific protein 10 n=1 Tax=Patellaria atrata CBS 101060 TaxID=1346257 RepID=A0A9P4S4H3_9PEZI|nr:hypothetical protein M501DRAFT_1060515 [Patellaria atrata CBS 101060]
MADTNPGNFANRPTEEVKEIASKGGHASHSSAETNPGNFANRPTEEVQEIASKGGHASRSSADTNPGNFANRPKEEVREIAAEGGRTSGNSGDSADSSETDTVAADEPGSGRNPDGTFTKGSEAAKEAGAKGGSK